MHVWTSIKRMIKAVLVFVLIGGLSIFLYEEYNDMLCKENDKGVVSKERTYNKKEFEEQIEVKEELEPLMDTIRAVMKGELIIEDGNGNMLSLYTYNEELYPNVTRIDSYAELISAKLGETTGKIVIEYSIVYYDKKGECTRKSSSLNTEMIIEKLYGNWEVVDVLMPY